MRVFRLLLTASLVLGAPCAAQEIPDLRSQAGRLLGTPDPDTIEYPSGFPPTPAEIALGKTLFFDPRLSTDRTVSCATCHNPDLGLGDGLARSHGVNGAPTPRNAPHLHNLAWTPLLFWDGRAASLEDQALAPIQAPGEMAMDLPVLLARLNGVPHYQQAFQEVYGAGPATSTHLASALASFERSLVVRNTAYDRWQAGDDRALGPEAVRGLGLFLGKASCIDCHSGPNFSDGSFHNLGLGGTDRGRAAIVPGAAAEGAFKTPGLRNALLTAPYFHDGRIESLEAVVRFYNRGGDAPTPDPLVRPLGLTDREVLDLVAFLGALTEPLVIERPVLPPDGPCPPPVPGQGSRP